MTIRSGLQAFYVVPSDIATALYYAGIDPFTKKTVPVAKNMRDRKMQRALMQFFKPTNWFNVREALIEAKRTDLIGNGCDCLILANPPKEAIEARRRRANPAVNGEDDHYHSVANPANGEQEAGSPKSTGYRLGRKSQHRRPGKNRKGIGRSGVGQ